MNCLAKLASVWDIVSLQPQVTSAKGWQNIKYKLINIVIYID